MKGESDARITVLTRIDLRPLHFRKEVDRNVDNLTFVTAVFDQDGHEITAQEKDVQLRMLDGTPGKILAIRHHHARPRLTSSPELIWCGRSSAIPRVAKSPV